MSIRWAKRVGIFVIPRDGQKPTSGLGLSMKGLALLCIGEPLQQLVVLGRSPNRQCVRFRLFGMSFFVFFGLYWSRFARLASFRLVSNRLVSFALVCIVGSSFGPASEFLVEWQK